MRTGRSTSRDRSTARAEQRTREHAAVDATAAEARHDTHAVVRLVDALSRTSTADDAMGTALDAVRSAFGWVYGSYWHLDPSERVLRFALESGAVTEEFRVVTRGAHFAEGEGVSGRAWHSRDLYFVQDLGEMRDCCRAPVAQRAGVRSGVCFPIIVDGAVRGTMELAKETAKATEEIEHKIEAIQADTRGAVEAMAQVSGTIHSISDLQNTIASAVEDQTATTNEIGRHVGAAARGASSIAENITTVAHAAQSTTAGAEAVERAAGNLAQMGATLEQIVSEATL